MSNRFINNVCSQYNIAKKEFLNNIAKLAQQPDNVIISCGVVDLVIPLLTDVNPSIQTTAAITLGKLGSHSEDDSCKLLKHYNIMFHLIKDFKMKDSYYQKNVMYALGSIGKHSSTTAQLVANGGGIKEIIFCLESFNLQIKEAACWATGLIGRTDNEIAKILTNQGVIPLLINCLEEKNVSLQVLSISSLGNIGKQCKDAAKIIMERGGFYLIAKYVVHVDVKHKVVALNSLGHFASHAVELAQGVLATKVKSHIVSALSSKNNAVKVSAVYVITNIAKHNEDMAKAILNEGIMGELINNITNAKSEPYLQTIRAIGHIASHSSDMALHLAKENAVYHMVNILQNNTCQQTLTATVWALGQIGKHSDREVEYICVARVLNILLEHYQRTSNTAQLREQCNASLKLIFNKCKNVGVLITFLHNVPCEIQEYVISKLKNLLPNDSKARYEFVKTGGLTKLLSIEPELGSEIFEDINTIKLCFPQDIVRYCMPNYPAGFMARLESFYPELHPHFIAEEAYKVIEDDSDTCLHLQKKLMKENAELE